jgi:hypothetical protein
MTLRVSGYSWPAPPGFDFASTTTTTTTTTTSNISNGSSSSSGTSRSRSSGTCSAAGEGERRLPIIHVEGEMTGLDHEVTRYLQGTISMIRDGVVRWSLVSLSSSCYREEGTNSVFFKLLSKSQVTLTNPLGNGPPKAYKSEGWAAPWVSSAYGLGRIMRGRIRSVHFGCGKLHEETFPTWLNTDGH